MSEPTDPIEEIVITGQRLPPLPILDNQRKFFDQFHDKIVGLAQQHNIDENLLLGLSAYESGWFGNKDAIANNNPFGVNRPGKKILQTYETIDDALEYWGRVFGPRVAGVQTPEEFQNRLRTKGVGAYNSDNPHYDEQLGGVIDSVKMKRPQWLRQQPKSR
jgi:hypothetical protein